MAAILKTYDVVCPDCAEEFKVNRDPAELAKGDGKLIKCPNCYDEFEWDYDQATGTLELTPPDDDDEVDDLVLTCEDEDDEEDDYE